MLSRSNLCGESFLESNSVSLIFFSATFCSNQVGLLLPPPSVILFYRRWYMFSYLSFLFEIWVELCRKQKIIIAPSGQRPVVPKNLQQLRVVPSILWSSYWYWNAGHFIKVNGSVMLEDGRVWWILPPVQLRPTLPTAVRLFYFYGLCGAVIQNMLKLGVAIQNILKLGVVIQNILKYCYGTVMAGPWSKICKNW